MLLTTEWLQKLYMDVVREVYQWTTAERKLWLHSRTIEYSAKKSQNVKNIASVLLEQEVYNVLFSVPSKDFSQRTVEFRRAWACVEKEFWTVR